MLKSRDSFERTSFKMNILHAFVLLVFICTRYGCDSRKTDKKSPKLCKDVLVNMEENSKSITKLEATVAEQLKDLRSELHNAIRIITVNGNANLALRRSATQSSTDSGGAADKATDGNTDGEWTSSSCTHTDSEANPWWRVDLRAEISINKVVIHNRLDCCGERLHDLILTVSNTTNGGEVICGQYKGPSTNGAIETIWCAPGTVGRFLKIKIDGNDYLTLCEVEVY